MADERPLAGIERFARQTSAFVILYAVGCFALIVLGTEVLGAGDSDLSGFVGQVVYFTLWSLLFSPAVCTAVFGLWLARARPLGSWLLAGGYLGCILLALIICFVLDAHITTALLADMVLGTAFVVGGAVGARSNRPPAP